MTEDSDELNFKGNNPGSVQHGNFINYYQFHPPEYRLKLLPIDIWTTDKPFYGLDLGCNSGDLTEAVHNFMARDVIKQNHAVRTLALDIDPVLIDRCLARNGAADGITYCCLDFMTKDGSKRQLIGDYMSRWNVSKFSAVFCFSITMWVHLNHGDDGLRWFLREISRLGELVIIEPQPWKCYKAAVKRMRLGNGDFPLYSQLTIRGHVEDEIERFLIEECGLVKINETTRSEWNRKILIFKNCNTNY